MLVCECDDVVTLYDELMEADRWMGCVVLLLIVLLLR